MDEDTTESLSETNEPADTELKPSFSENGQLGTTYVVSMINMETKNVSKLRFQFKYRKPRIGGGFRYSEILFPNEWTNSARRFWEIDADGYSDPKRVFLLKHRNRGVYVAVFHRFSRMEQLFQCGDKTRINLIPSKEQEHK